MVESSFKQVSKFPGGAWELLDGMLTRPQSFDDLYELRLNLLRERRVFSDTDPLAGLDEYYSGLSVVHDLKKLEGFVEYSQGYWKIIPARRQLLELYVHHKRMENA